MFYIHDRFQYENVKTISTTLESAQKLKFELSKLKVKLIHTQDKSYLEFIDRLGFFENELHEFIKDYMFCLQKGVQCNSKTIVNSIFIFLNIFNEIDEFSHNFLIKNKRVFVII